MAVDFGTGYIDVEPRVDKGAAESAMKRDLGSSLTSAGKKMTSVGASMTAGLTLPIVAFGTSAVKAFQESAAVGAQTAAVIKSTGGEAGVTAKEVQSLSAALSEKSAMDDEAIASGQNMLLTFTNIKDGVKASDDVFSDATRTLVDMSTALGTDAKTQAVALGKALNDPVKGVSALSRVGVTFTDQQKKQIEAMQEAGDTAGAQRIILDELAKEFGGSAAAFRNSAAGEGAANTIAMGNAMEELGGVINSVVAPVLGALAGWLKGAVDWFTKLSPGIKTAVVVVLALVAAAGPLLIILGSIATAIGAITAPVLIAVAAIAALIAIGVLLAKNWDAVMAAAKPVLDFLKGLFIPIWEALKEVWTDSILPALKDLWAAVKALWPVLKVMLIVALAPIVLAFIALMKVLPIVLKVLGVLIRIVAAVIRVVAELVGWLANKLAGAFSAVWDTATNIFEKLKGGWEAVKRVAVGVWDAIRGAFDTLVDGIRNLWNSTVGGFGFTVPDIPGMPGRGQRFEIPEMAEGGIVRSPLLAVVGEAGPEAVVPLDRLGDLGAGSRGAQVIEGRLTLTPESEVLIRGIARDEDDVTARRLRTGARMNPRGRAAS